MITSELFFTSKGFFDDGTFFADNRAIDNLYIISFYNKTSCSCWGKPFFILYNRGVFYLYAQTGHAVSDIFNIVRSAQSLDDAGCGFSISFFLCFCFISGADLGFYCCCIGSQVDYILAVFASRCFQVEFHDQETEEEIHYNDLNQTCNYIHRPVCPSDSCRKVQYKEVDNAVGSTDTDI